MSDFRKHIAERLVPYKRIVLWGSGGLGRQAISQWLPAEKIIHVIDSNIERHGDTIEGREIKPPSILFSEKPDCVVITSTAFLEVAEALQQSGYKGPYFYVYDLIPHDVPGMSEMKKLCIDIAVQKSSGWFELLTDRPQVLVNLSYRLIRHAQNSPLLILFRPLFKIFHTIISAGFSIYIPPQVNAGPGLAFAHYGTMVIRRGAQLGSFCTLYHNVTIGTDKTGAVPSAGNFVTIYTGSTVIGDSRIGDYCRIGAHSLVIGLSCPDNTTIGGQPAKILRRYNPPERK